VYGFFPRNTIPADLQRGSMTSDPTKWGEPVAFWELGSNCAYTHFSNMQMVFDLTFCGDWAGNGNVWPNECPGKGTCSHYVKETPTAFKEAYWSINFVKVMSS